MNNLERYFDSKCKNPGKNTVSLQSTLLDPRYKSAGFRSKNNAGIAKELLIQEVITDRQSNNSSPQTLNISDRSIASETPSADPWDAIVVDTEDSEKDATEAPDSLVFLSLFGLQLPLTFCNLLLMK